MIPILYRGSVKDLLGPLPAVDPKGGRTVESAIFEYSDAFSVFDWGRMPDLLSGKGQALAVLAAEWFEMIERPETWQAFSKTAEAQRLRKSNKFGGLFNELGERLQKEGLPTHYLGLVSGDTSPVKPLRTGNVDQPLSRFAVRRVGVVKPTMTTVQGRVTPDYSPTRAAPAPKLIPLEVVFRFSCPPGSSAIERLGIPAGTRWEFPLLELFTKLEPTDRPVDSVEGLAISGLTGSQMQELLFKTAWVAGLIKTLCENAGLELADGKLEWGLDQNGQIFLVDAIGPDELRLLKNGVQLSKEFLRGFYRQQPWYDAVVRAKKEAADRGEVEWKKRVSVPVPALPEVYRETVSQMYRTLANELSGRKWFPQAWSVDQVVSKLRELGGAS
ncbi:hypothetical protein K2X30_05690 [bacterium]|jgi:phosphoribosylaminoimidazole-succinocarboxamide synthase|nr:hypothetical protein [bacterium]